MFYVGDVRLVFYEGDVRLVFYEGDVGLVSDWCFMRETSDGCQIGVL